MGRVLAIDFGERRIGLAITDETKTIAQPLGTISVERSGEPGRDVPRASIQAAVVEIAKIVSQQDVERVIVGSPVGLSGQSTVQSERTALFGKVLAEQVSVPVEFIDERFTTELAHRYLSASYPRHHQRRRKADRVAAAIMLSDWLRRHQS